jgi:signal transduction histidine kinase
MAARQAELRAPTGETFQVNATSKPLARDPLKFSIWAIGAVFALLGAAVALRRPDLVAARLFTAFAWLAALGLAVAPDAGGIGNAWALALEMVSMLGVTATFFPFVAAMGTAPPEVAKKAIPMGVMAALLLAAGYAISVSFAPQVYVPLRSAVRVCFSLSLAGGIVLLAREVVRRRPTVARRQSAIALVGTAGGTLPFVALTLLPGAAGLESMPSHITILALGLMPAAFAYALLQHQLLGIRRLVHRGMVYGIAALLLLTAETLAFDFVARLEDLWPELHDSPWIFASLLTAGIIAFFPLRTGAQILVDRFLYRDVPDYRVLMKAMREDLIAAGRSPDVATGLAVRLAGALNVESVLVFLGESMTMSKLAAVAGARAPEVLDRIYPQLQPYLAASDQQELADLTWEADSFLVAKLAFSKQYLGYILLGPKGSGEVFSREQKRLVETIIPLATLAISEAQLAEELRDLNQRLLKAEENGRALIAGDLHDGPLQKALLIARTSDTNGDTRALANQLVYELREICSRLRPAILDDLGLAPALEWLLDGLARRSGISVHLTLHNILEDERFPPDVELALFRVTQEAANNAHKHSGCSTLEVTLMKNNGRLVLRVTDDGAGFSAPNHKGGFGLSGMRERISQVHGSFQILTTPGLGTTVTATVPLGRPQTPRKETLEVAG